MRNEGKQCANMKTFCCFLFFFEEWKVPVCSDHGLNLNAPSHTLCILFTHTATAALVFGWHRDALKVGLLTITKWAWKVELCVYKRHVFFVCFFTRTRETWREKNKRGGQRCESVLCWRREWDGVKGVSQKYRHCTLKAPAHTVCCNLSL